jgi:hypothetical protein
LAARAEISAALHDLEALVIAAALVLAIVAAQVPAIVAAQVSAIEQAAVTWAAVLIA